MQNQRTTILNYSKGFEALLKKINSMDKAQKDCLLDFNARYIVKKRLSPARQLKLMTIFCTVTQMLGKSLLGLSEKDLEKINLRLANRNITKTTINDYKKVLKIFLSWSGQKHLLESTELELLKLNGETKITAKNLPTEEEAYKIYQALNTKYRALLCLLHGGGLRLSEAVTLRKGSIEFKDDQSIVCHVEGKTGYREVPIQPSLAHFLREYVNKAGIASSDALLFGGEKGSQFLSYTAVTKAFSRAAARVGISGKKTHPHSWRHVHATWALLNLPAPLAKMRLWGNATSGMDKNYLHVSQAQSMQEYRKVTGLEKAPEAKQLFDMKRNVCFKCGKSFDALTSVCSVCNVPLNPKEIIERGNDDRQRFEALVELVAQMRLEMEELRGVKA